MSPPKNDGDEEIGSFLKRAILEKKHANPFERWQIV
jgi:hypothetical protein